MPFDDVGVQKYWLIIVLIAWVGLHHRHSGRSAVQIQGVKVEGNHVVVFPESLQGKRKSIFITPAREVLCDQSVIVSWAVIVIVSGQAKRLIGAKGLVDL